MKKRLTFLCATILVLAFVLSSCGGGDNAYKGNYEEITEEQAKEYLASITELEEVLAGKSTKSTFTITTKDDDTNDETKVTGTSVVDFSDPKNMKMSEDLTVKRTTKDGTYAMSIKAFTDTKTGKMLIDISATAPGKDKYTFKGQIQSEALSTVQNLTGATSAEDLLYELGQALEDFGEENDAKIYVDGNKMKMVYDVTEEWGTEQGEMYVVIEKNDFRCKSTSNTHMNYGETDTAEVEIVLVNETVTIPSSGYDKEMTLTEFASTLRTYLGY